MIIGVGKAVQDILVPLVPKLGEVYFPKKQLIERISVNSPTVATVLAHTQELLAPERRLNNRGVQNS